MSNREFEGDAGAPLPDFTGASNIQLTTIAPALGVGSRQQPDYLDYDQKGRGIVVTMFANTGMSYLLGIGGGGLYGLQRGIASTPSSKFKVQVNSILNHCGRYGSKAGNTLGVFAVLFSLYEGLGDNLELDRYTGFDSTSPPLAAMMTGVTYYAPSGVRVAALGGALGLGAVGATYTAYSLVGKPFGSYGFLWF
ncbi:Tim17/Tim22/Tim23/Pmp24 family protein [Nitzschia inconspicua]|uniref:Tim17/Tim22/Tim23/Pmp24 family protein n=1 Tax=Nitzschia inconspicua TaxID=303405 RepID=A0A9K3Q7D3_9STRA|nr:Tim17/Tim22/Tim23/Pmp24 family protein [Nitzschia inconspicua]